MKCLQNQVTLKTIKSEAQTVWIDHCASPQFGTPLGNRSFDVAEEITSVLYNMTDKHVISKEIFNYLWPQKPRTSQFCIPPKIHKDGTPGRPIVSSCGAPTEKISQIVDFILKPLVEKMPSYIKDTTDFLLKLRSVGNVPPGSLLVTLDVRSLYTNIPHDEGVEACRELLNTRTSD